MAKSVASLRVHHLAKELGVESKVILEKCKAENIPDIIGHMSQVKAGLAATIREWFSTEHASQTAIETAAPVDIAEARAKARKRPSRATKKKADDTSDNADQSNDGDTATAIAEPETKSAPAKRSTTTSRVTPSIPSIETAESDIDDADSEGTDTATSPDEEAPAIAASAPAATTPAPSAPARPSSVKPPVMNVPDRPKHVKPVGQVLQQPTKTKLAGPKIIRVEQPDVLPTPSARSDRRGPGGPGMRPGTRMGSGVGMPPTEDPRGRGVGPGANNRRNKRRTGAGAEEAGRTGRAFVNSPVEETTFNWRSETDLAERDKRLQAARGFFTAHRVDKNKKHTGGGHRAQSAAETGGKVSIEEPITVKSLSAATGVKTSDILKKLLLSGKMATINSALDANTAAEVMLEYSIELEVTEQVTAEQQIAQTFKAREMVDPQPRAPVVTILGHVDHGKTTLLDRIRNTNIAAGEAGGITQSTRAFQVPVKTGDKSRMITFIDTPGHEAFTEMRARGAKVTDIVVLVVAADDGVMPQTIESINHAKAAGVPIVVALNKIDKPEATDSNIQRILGQLAGHGLNPVEWGGNVEVIKLSALKTEGIQDLLDVLDYQADLLELQADFGGKAEGTCLEARLVEGRGAVANVIVQQGVLKRGDFVVIGRAYGRVRDITGDHAQRIEEATPSMCVTFSGIDEVPDAGDKFYIVSSIKEAEAAAAERRASERERSLARERVTLDNIFQKLSESGRKELALIVKGDVQGSVESLVPLLEKLTTDKVTIVVKHSAVGGINDSDIALADAAGAIIVGFNVTATGKARQAAEARGVDIRLYDVIYDITDDIAKAVEGLLEPELKLEVLGHADVREVFRITRVGMIAGCYVTDGVIERNSQIRVTRDGIVIEKDRRLEQLKRFKDDVKEVRAGQECGMKIDGYDDIKVGDVLECYKTTQVRRRAQD